MILGAIAAMEIEDLLSSVIALGAVGFGLTLAFLLLRAPDLAITQLVVEILSVIILIRATVGLKLFKEGVKIKLGYLVFGIIFAVMFLFLGYKVLAEIPTFGKPIMKIGSQYIASAMEKTSATNIVSAIILDFRAYDTLGEATVLFTSVIGTLAVLRGIGRKDR
ncbi:MAG: hydrogen gas-evolving membrane-bound hydrogenase subunit E [Candidatus Omnitrophota bacterium]